ncbi:MAG: DRTGG domain-containing protein [Acutalibacteraceae bacterium]|nr:DRTGG domain-containing protein [Acutalibacteraceae bacterium]
MRDLAERLQLKILAGEDATDRDVQGCYTGDLLSWVMGRAQEGDAWLTVMGNINAIAVATLADTACIILTENAPLDEAARQKAQQQQVAVLQTEENSYHTAIHIHQLLGDGSE